MPARPVPMEALQRLEAEAEIIYRENRRDSDDALVEVYETLAELAPDRFSRAWLRIGNIRQRAGKSGEAAEAYRRVRGSAEERKALLNLTALTLEEARQALARLEALPATSPKPGVESAGSVPVERGEHALIGDLQRQLQAAEQNLIERQQRRSGATAGEREFADGTHMIDRYTASARRNAVKSARGSLHVDPADESIARPVPPPRSRPAAESLPSVEYLLGDPLRSRQKGANEGEASAASSAAGLKGGTGKAAPGSAGEVGGRAPDPVKGGSQR